MSATHPESFVANPLTVARSQEPSAMATDAGTGASSTASAATHAAAPSRGMLWTGRVLSGLAVAFLAFDCVLKLVGPPEAVEGTKVLGWAASTLVPLGILQLVLLTIHLVPRTAVIGAVLWTGYLGGAIATHVRVGNPLFSHVLFPIYVAAFLWIGLALRDQRARAILAPRPR